MKIRVLIADDEPLAREGVRQLLAGQADIEIVGEAGDGREALQLLLSLAPDLVFLDIQMPELDGFGVLADLRAGLSPLVVFVTAYDAFALKAFDAEALDYLVKPLSAPRFAEMMARTRRRLQERRLSRRIDAAGERGEGGDGPRRRLRAPTDLGERLIDLDEITWIEAFDYYVVIHASRRRFLLRESLTSLEARLDDAWFLRTHRCALVNLAHVREVRAEARQGDRVALSDGAEAPVSRRRRRALSLALERLYG